jgi:hypothetical protein
VSRAAVILAVAGLGLLAEAGAAQYDPVFQYAAFYDGLLEFSTCSTMTVNGPVHANGNIYTGTDASLTFNSTVTTASTLSSPANNGQGPWPFPGGQFNGNPGYVTNVGPRAFLMPFSPHGMLEIPPAGEDPTSSAGQSRLYNQAQAVLLVSNTAVTLTIQTMVNMQVPGADPSPIVLTSATNVSAVAAAFPFLCLTNTFCDNRELKTNLTTQIDVGKYAGWMTTNNSVQAKFPAGSGTYATILYVADTRSVAANQMTVLRLTNGMAPPANGGLGFTVATPSPLYVMGNYNCTNPAFLGTTNTSATVPCALMSDALTILSPSWRDRASWNYKSGSAVPMASSTTVNAAILTGLVPSTGSGSTQFSGGIHNLTRLLEDWGQATFTLNTSLVCPFNSQQATHRFINPGTYYTPPTRLFSFDANFNDLRKLPPGTPMVLNTNLPAATIIPQSQAVIVGGNAVFNIQASGALPLSYQWRFNGSDIAGETNCALSLSAVQTTNAGSYQAVVTDICGSVTSNSATLLVYASAAPALVTPGCAANNAFRFTIFGVPGFNYAIEASTNLADWTRLTTNLSPFSFVDTNASTLPACFYRAVYLP